MYVHIRLHIPLLATFLKTYTCIYMYTLEDTYTGKMLLCKHQLIISLRSKLFKI